MNISWPCIIRRQGIIYLHIVSVVVDISKLCCQAEACTNEKVFALKLSLWGPYSLFYRFPRDMYPYLQKIFFPAFHTVKNTCLDRIIHNGWQLFLKKIHGNGLKSDTGSKSKSHDVGRAWEKTLPTIPTSIGAQCYCVFLCCTLQCVGIKNGILSNLMISYFESDLWSPHMERLLDAWRIVC